MEHNLCFKMVHSMEIQKHAENEYRVFFKEITVKGLVPHSAFIFNKRAMLELKDQLNNHAKELF